jgi:hypothetical protein
MRGIGRIMLAGRAVLVAVAPAACSLIARSAVSFPRLFFSGLFKSHSWAAAVFVNELDAGGLQGSADR